MNPADEATERLLHDAGIGPGMRVLDVGCGHGAVTAMIARRVDEDGAVVGLDRDAGALALARDRDLPNAEFVEGDLLEPPQWPFDAVVGRRVLMYQPDPTAAVRALVGVLRPGGVMAFQEHDMTMGPGRIAPLPLHEGVRVWFVRMLEHEGADPRLGFRLASVFAAAGLEMERVRAEAIVQTPTQAYVTGTIVRAVLPRIVASGAATEAEIDAETIDARLAEELRAADATYVGEMVFTAWARKPTA